MFDLMPVLLDKRIVKTEAVHSPTDGFAHQRPNHQGWHKREFMGHLEYNEDSRHRRAHDTAETRAHSYHG